MRARAEQGNINHPAYGTWTADFMLRQNESRVFLGKYLNDPRVPWRHKRRELMAIAGIIPVAKWLAKIKQLSDVNCRLCKREQHGANSENLPEETDGHINSAFCDGMATTVILGFRRSSDRNEDFLRVTEDEANEQHRSIIEVLRVAALEWRVEQINFVAGRHGAVVEDDFYNKLAKLNVQAGKRGKILLAHVQRICEAHDTVMRSYYQQIHGSSGADATTSMENIGEQVYVQRTHNLFVISC